jgi:cobyrinic acid a,c-diamide synthase
LVYLSPLTDKHLPNLDGLYLGGGFPETHGKQLAENATFREDMRRAAESGMPIYAECGGLMYLGESLEMDGKKYPMTGILPVDYGFSRRPRGHGYTVVDVMAPNPYFEVGSQIRGHEFHYSYVSHWRGKTDQLAFKMARGTGFIENRCGVTYKNVLGTYTHIHALGTPQWAPCLVRAARRYGSAK